MIAVIMHRSESNKKITLQHSMQAADDDDDAGCWQYFVLLRSKALREVGGLSFGRN